MENKAHIIGVLNTNEYFKLFFGVKLAILLL